MPVKSKVDWDAAVNWMMRQSQNVGIFNPDRIRGRGAWLDSGKKVLNIGDSLVIDNIQVPFDQYDGDYVYEQGETLTKFDDEPLTDAEAQEVLGIFKSLRWEDQIFALQMAGWCVTAPVCGALPWRAHLWLTAGAGGGKSWVVNNIILPLLAKTNINVQSATTEAGIRQTLNSDALPVVFDEAEQEGRRERERMQAVLELMRQASSENAAPIKKGSSSHVAKSFNIRSQFLLISINVGLRQQADQSRVAVVALREPAPKEDAEAFARETAEFVVLREKVEKKIDAKFGRRFVSRSISMIDKIYANVDSFRRAASDLLGSSRLGDTAGALFAGAYSLTSSEVVDVATARAWLEAQGLRQENFMQNIERDETQCFNLLMRHELEVESLDNRRLRRTVVELANVAQGGGTVEIHQDMAQAALLRRGFKVMDNILWISNQHSGIAEILKEKDAPWTNGWGRILGRLPFRDRSEATQKAIYFGPTDVHRAVAIPMAHLKRRAEFEAIVSPEIRTQLL
jgi:putative DNA primase/helicase